jgi:hypothetical protein
MMSTSTHHYGARQDEGLTRRDELAVSGSVLSEAPWGLAVGAGAVTTVADMVIHLMAFHFAIGGPLAMGAVAFFAVAGGGALLRSRRGRALLWAQRNPWRFAALPGLACAAVVLVLSVVAGGGLLGSVFTGLWHGALAFGVTGLVGSVGRPRQARS